MYLPSTLSHCHLVVQERGCFGYYLWYVWNVVIIIAATPAERELQLYKRLACKQSYLPFSPSRYKLWPCKHTLKFQFPERILALHLGMLPARNMSYCYSSPSTLRKESMWVSNKIRFIHIHSQPCPQDHQYFKQLGNEAKTLEAVQEKSLVLHNTNMLVC